MRFRTDRLRGCIGLLLAFSFGLKPGLAEYFAVSAMETPAVSAWNHSIVSPCTVSVILDVFPERLAGWRLPARYHLSTGGREFFSFDAIVDHYTYKTTGLAHQAALQYGLSCFEIEDRAYVFLAPNIWLRTLDREYATSKNASDECLAFVVDQTSSNKSVSLPFLKDSCSPAVINSHLVVIPRTSEVLFWFRSSTFPVSGETSQLLLDQELNIRAQGLSNDLDLFSAGEVLFATGHISEFGTTKFALSQNTNYLLAKSTDGGSIWQEVKLPLKSFASVIPVLVGDQRYLLVGSPIPFDPPYSALVGAGLPNGELSLFRVTLNGQLELFWTKKLPGLIKVESDTSGDRFKATVATEVELRAVCAFIPGIHCIDDYGAGYKRKVVEYRFLADGTNFVSK